MIQPSSFIRYTIGLVKSVWQMLSKSPPTDQRACVPDVLVAMRQLPVASWTSAQKMPGLLLQTQNVRLDGFQLAPLMFAVKSASKPVNFNASVLDSAGHGLTANTVCDRAAQISHGVVILIAPSRLFGFVDVELFDAVENVPEAAAQCEDARRVQRPLIGRTLDLQQHPAEDDHLEKRRALADDARAGRNVAGQHVNQHGADQQNHVAADDQHGKPKGQLVKRRALLEANAHQDHR